MLGKGNGRMGGAVAQEGEWGRGAQQVVPGGAVALAETEDKSSIAGHC